MSAGFVNGLILYERYNAPGKGEGSDDAVRILSSLIGAICIAAAPLAWLLWLSGAVTIPAALAAMLLFSAVVFTAGALLLRLSHAQDMSHAAAWVFGVFASSLAVYALVEWLHLRAATAFAVWSIAVFGCAAAFRQPSSARRGIDLKELLGLALCAATTLMWCWEVAEAPAMLARDQGLMAWIDYFIHGGVISQFGDPLAGRQSMYLVDFPAPFYHFASYMLPAAFAWPLDLPGLPLATSAWLPIGFLTMCAGAYALGAARAGPAGGIAAVAVLTMLPDAAAYGLRNGFLSFHWHLLALPGATYVIGVFLLAIALLQRWSQLGGPRPLLASAALVAGSVLFRVHVFALGAPAWLASVALSTRFVQARRLVFFGAACTAFALFVFAFYRITDSDLALELFLAGVHNLQEPTAYSGWYRGLLETYGAAVAVPAGIGLMLVGCLGVFVVLYPIAVLVSPRSVPPQAIDAMPAYLVVSYLLLMLAAPIAGYRDPTEFTVRPFVLLYAVIAVWTVCAFVNRLALQPTVGGHRLWWALLLTCALALPLLWNDTAGLGRIPKFHWGWRHISYKPEPGLVQAGAFLRQRSRPADVFAVRGLKLGWTATDASIQLVALTGMPAYLAYPFAQTSIGGPREKVAMERYAALMRIAAAPQAAAALKELRSRGIAWYVVIGSEGPRWDPERRQAAFVERRVAVYAVPEVK
jgi:hypothetical protein